MSADASQIENRKWWRAFDLFRRISTHELFPARIVLSVPVIYLFFCIVMHHRWSSSSSLLSSLSASTSRPSSSSTSSSLLCKSPVKKSKSWMAEVRSALSLRWWLRHFLLQYLWNGKSISTTQTYHWRKCHRGSSKNENFLVPGIRRIDFFLKHNFQAIERITTLFVQKECNQWTTTRNTNENRFFTSYNTKVNFRLTIVQSAFIMCAKYREVK